MSAAVAAAVLARSPEERALEWGMVPLELAVLCGSCGTISANTGGNCPRCAAPPAQLESVAQLLPRPVEGETMPDGWRAAWDEVEEACGGVTL